MRFNRNGENALAALICGGTLANAALYSQTVETKTGKVQGYAAFNSTTGVNVTNWEAITVWKGIPFAATTAGANRWRAPQPATAWTETLNASAFGPICPSTKSFGTDGAAVDENCLSLNIWSAAKSGKANLPVVMWSTPAESTASDALFDGGGMASQDVVFVNYNYRTGAFGWMAHPTLSEERYALNGHNSSGNYGMLDQQAALKWIRANIKAFGGNPDHITVMGQSAGSAASYHITISPLTKGLIVGAIIESGVRAPRDPLSTSLAENYINLTTSVAQGPSFLSSLNISSIAEARTVNYTTLVTSFQDQTYSFTATLDHYALPDTYENVLKKGAANQVPIITGNTKDESGATYGLNLTLAEYDADLNETFSGEWYEKFLEAYPAANASVAGHAYNAQWSDRSKVGTYFWTQLWYSASKKPVWTYFWDHAPPGQTQGAYHESEINYVLNNLYDTDLPWETADYKIAKTMNQYWVNFIKFQNPNGKGLNKWPVTGSSATTQRLGDGFEQVAVASKAHVALFKAWFATLVAY